MENKVNIAEILKECPPGIELYSPLCGKCVFDRLNMGTIICKKQNTQEITFTSEGYYMLTVFDDCECMIFPSKDQRDWNKFQRPFKDGDILACNQVGHKNSTIYIYYHNETQPSRYYIALIGDELKISNRHFPTLSSVNENTIRLATKKEKEKLFKELKENGYKWNSDTKTLEKLFVPKFKDGDIIFTHANCLKVGLGNTWISIFKETRNGGVATYVDCCENDVDYYDDLDGDKPLLCMESDILRQRLATQEEKEKLFEKIKENGYKWNADTKTLEKLVEPKFKVGDKITDGNVSITINYMDNECYYDMGRNNVTRLFIKYQDDWELVPGKIEPKFKVGDKIRLKENHNYIYTITGIREEENKYECGVTFVLKFSEQDNWELVPEKFDINTLVPFESKVLVRNAKDYIWKPAIFGGYNDKTSTYYVLGGICWKYCIPYEGNEHLCCKTGDCDEIYKNW